MTGTVLERKRCKNRRKKIAVKNMDTIIRFLKKPSLPNLTSYVTKNTKIGKNFILSNNQLSVQIILYDKENLSII